VLIGVTAHGQQDYQFDAHANATPTTSPRGRAGSDVRDEVHAHILARFRIAPSSDAGLALGRCRCCWWSARVLGHALSRLSLGWGFVVVFVHHWLWKVIAVAAFSWFAWRIEVVAMLLLGFVLYTATFALRWRTLRRMLGIVKSEGIALALEADPRRLDPGGEEREVTVLFADVRSFTDFSRSTRRRRWWRC